MNKLKAHDDIEKLKNVPYIGDGFLFPG